MATKSISPDKDVRDLVRRAEDLGYTAVRTNGGHVKLTHPYVEMPIFCPSTPSEYRSLKNAEALIYRSVAPSANDRLRNDLDRADEITAQIAGPREVNECPACRGRGVVKSFAHPQGLVAHMVKEHPVTVEEVNEWNQPFEDQPEEDVTTEPEQPEQETSPVRATELEDYLEGRLRDEDLEPGEVVTLDELRDAFDGRNVTNVIMSLKKRSEGLRLEQHGSRRSGQYRVVVDEPEIEPEVTPPGYNEFSEARIYEEVNRFVDGRVLLRDAEGNLYQAEIEPLT